MTSVRSPSHPPTTTRQPSQVAATSRPNLTVSNHDTVNHHPPPQRASSDPSIPRPGDASDAVATRRTLTAGIWYYRHSRTTRILESLPTHPVLLTVLSSTNDDPTKPPTRPQFLTTSPTLQQTDESPQRLPNQGSQFYITPTHQRYDGGPHHVLNLTISCRELHSTLSHTLNHRRTTKVTVRTYIPRESKCCHHHRTRFSHSRRCPHPRR